MTNSLAKIRTQLISARMLTTCLSLCGAMAQAQVSRIYIHVEFVNATAYFSGYCAVADIGKNSNRLTRPTPAPPFAIGVGIADIVSVNGTPVKGTAIETFNGTLLSPTVTSGRAIGDFTAAPTSASFELTFLNPDGTLIGTLEIHGQGTSSDLRPPGAPSDFPGGSLSPAPTLPCQYQRHGHQCGSIPEHCPAMERAREIRTNDNSRIIIHVARGIYNENQDVGRSL